MAAAVSKHHDYMIRVICRDKCHHDTNEFRARGHHYLCSLQLGADGTGPVLLAKQRPSRGLPHDEITEYAEDGAWPFKDFHRADGVRVLRFRCHRDRDLADPRRAIGCGRNVEAEEATVLEFVRMLYVAALAGTTRVFLDIAELERSLTV